MKKTTVAILVLVTLVGFACASDDETTVTAQEEETTTVMSDTDDVEESADGDEEEQTEDTEDVDGDVGEGDVSDGDVSEEDVSDGDVSEEDVSDDDESQDPEPAVLPELKGDDPVFVWSETGGCAQMGPNCARYVVTADGTVTTFREGSDEVAATGVVDAALLDTWLVAVQETDLADLAGRAGPGEMTAAFDGVDFAVEAPHVGSSLSSIEMEFSPGEDYFAAAFALAQAAATQAPLTIESR